MMKIPFFNYPILFKQHEQELLDTIKDVCSRGAYILQKDLSAFEDNLRRYLKVKHVFGVADGTNALILGLMAMGIKPGDEVIVPSHTYIASASSIRFIGATPVLADMAADHLIEPRSIESLISERTKAIMPVHVNGRCCRMDAIEAIAARHQLQIIEDAAQGLGARYRGKYAGTFGACGTFSFYPAKVLGCFGDGGAIVTNDDAIAEKLGQLRDHGRNANGLVVSWGTNSRLDNLQAAIMNVKLKYFDAAIARRRHIAQKYTAAFSEIGDLTLPPAPEDDVYFDNFQNYEIQAGRRDELRSYLLERGVNTIIQWAGKAVHQFEGLGFENISLPHTEEFFKRCFLLPMHAGLTDEEVAYITDSVRAFYGLSRA